MMLIFLILFNTFLSRTSEQNLDKFFIQEDCLNFKIINLMKRHFSTRQCISFIYLTKDIYMPNEYFSTFKIPQVVRRNDENVYHPLKNMTYRPRRDFHTKTGTITEFCKERIEGFVLFSPNLETLDAYAFSNMLTVFMNPSAQFLILTSSPLTAPGVSPFILHLWRVYHAPHLALTCCSCTHVFTSTGTRADGVVMHELDHVEAKYRSNMHKLPFRTCMFPSVTSVDSGGEYEGVDRMLVDLLAERINFTKVIVTPPDMTYGRRQFNGSFNGALGSIIEGHSDMAAIGFFAMDYQTRDVELTQGVQVDDLCAVVHRAKEVPPWLAPVRYIGLEICLVMGLVYVGMAGTWIAIKRFEIPPRKYDTTLLFLNTFRLMLTTSVPRLSDTTCERLFLAFCTAAFVTLAGTFQGSLVTVYSTQFYYKDVNTLADLANMKMPILTRFESFKNDIFTNESNLARSKLKDLVEVYTANKSINDLITSTGKYGGLTRRSSLDLDKKTLQYTDGNGNSLLHIVRECVRTYNLAYMLPRASALSPRINEIILRASQSGLFVKWYNDMAMNQTRYQNKREQSSRRYDDNTPLAFIDLQLAMYGLGFGMILSLVTFLAEIVGIKWNCCMFCSKKINHK